MRTEALICFLRQVTEAQADPETTLLAFLRDKRILQTSSRSVSESFLAVSATYRPSFTPPSVRLTGTKYGCGGGGCGACTVMLSRYQPATKTITYPSARCSLIG